MTDNEAFTDRYKEQIDIALDRCLQQFNLGVEASFIQADLQLLRLAGVELDEVPGALSAPLESRPTKVQVVETKLGTLSYETVRIYEQKFKDGFYGLQGLGSSLSELVNDEAAVLDISSQMSRQITDLNNHLTVVGGRPVSGARHAAFYFTGEVGVPMRKLWSPFSNFPFHGVVDRVEATVAPGDGEADGLYACLVLKPYQDSSLDSVKGMNDDYPHSGIKEETWVPIGGVQFTFDHLLLSSDRAA